MGDLVTFLDGVLMIVQQVSGVRVGVLVARLGGRL